MPTLAQGQSLAANLAFTGNSGNNLENRQIREIPKDQSHTGVIRMEIQETSMDSSQSCHLGEKMGKSFEGPRAAPVLSQDLVAPPGPAVPEVPALLCSCHTPRAGVLGHGGGPRGPSPTPGVLEVRSGPGAVVTW